MTDYEMLELSDVVSLSSSEDDEETESSVSTPRSDGHDGDWRNAS